MEDKKATEYIFVYGTLLSDYGKLDSHKYLETYAELMGKATMKGKLYMVDYYPGVTPCGSEENYVVKGELYKLTNPDELFNFLDTYEEFYPMDPDHSEYVRRTSEVTLTKTGETFLAWVYYFNQDTTELEWLPKGDFLREYHK